MRAPIPKLKVVRALELRGFIKPSQAKAVHKALAEDKVVQDRFLKLWRDERGHRWSKLTFLAQWLWKHRKEIRAIISLVVMFADEQPEPKKPKHAGPDVPEQELGGPRRKPKTYNLGAGRGDQKEDIEGKVDRLPKW